MEIHSPQELRSITFDHDEYLITNDLSFDNAELPIIDNLRNAVIDGQDYTITVSYREVNDILPFIKNIRSTGEVRNINLEFKIEEEDLVLDSKNLSDSFVCRENFGILKNVNLIFNDDIKIRHPQEHIANVAINNYGIISSCLVSNEQIMPEISFHYSGITVENNGIIEDSKISTPVTENIDGFSGFSKTMNSGCIIDSTVNLRNEIRGVFDSFDGFVSNAVDARIKNCKFTHQGQKIKNPKHFSGIASHIENTVVDGCSVSDISVIGDVTSGGIVRQADNSTIKNCSVNTMHMEQFEGAGGIIGQGENTSIKNCSVTNLRTEFCDIAGGIASITKNGEISDCTIDKSVIGGDEINFKVGQKDKTQVKNVNINESHLEPKLSMP